MNNLIHIILWPTLGGIIFVGFIVWLFMYFAKKYKPVENIIEEIKLVELNKEYKVIWKKINVRESFNVRGGINSHGNSWATMGEKKTTKNILETKEIKLDKHNWLEQLIKWVEMENIQHLFADIKNKIDRLIEIKGE